MEAAEGIEPQEMTNYLFGFYAAVSNSEVIEGRGKGKGQNRGKGKGRHPGGKAGVITQMKIDDLKLEDCVPPRKQRFPSESVTNATTTCSMGRPNAHLAMCRWKHGVTIVLQRKSAGWKAVPLRSMASLPSVK